MSSNYPPGVSGNEYQISGPEDEYTDDREVSCGNDECSEYDKTLEVEVDIELYRGTETFKWQCPNCKSESEFTISRVEESGASDPDALHDGFFD